MARFSSTSYGPPWGGIQGTGVTATGVNLRDGQPRYGIAVDPAVIPLGSHVKVWPNPFGYRGTFEAFDTGGAIKGNRIDFYDWRGRTEQLRWGRRMVAVEPANTPAGILPGIPPGIPNPLDLLPDSPGDVIPNPVEGLASVGSALGNIAEIWRGLFETWLDVLRKITDPDTWKDAGKILLGFILLTIAVRRLFTVVT